MTRVLFLTIALVCTGCGQSAADRQFELDKMNTGLEAESKKLDDENKALELRIARGHFGDVFAAKFERCLFDPPKQPKNQKACADLRARYDKYEKELDEKQKKW
jgi:Skp family chaperone for outer membrane proteins